MLVEIIVKKLDSQEKVEAFFDDYKKSGFGELGHGFYCEEEYSKDFCFSQNTLSYKKYGWELNGKSILDTVCKNGFIENYGNEFYEKAMEERLLELERKNNYILAEHNQDEENLDSKKAKRRHGK